MRDATAIPILRALIECQRAIFRAHTEQEMLEGICRTVVETAGFGLAWIGLAEHDAACTVRPVAAAGADAGYLDAIQVTYADEPRGHGPTGTAIRTGEIRIVRTLDRAPEYAPWRAAATTRGFRSSAAFPLIAERRPFGALNVYAFEEDAFDGEARTLLSALAIDLAYGLAARRLQEDRMRVALDRLDVAVFSLDLDLRCTWASQARGNRAERDGGDQAGADLLPEPAARTVTAIARRALDAGGLARAEVRVPSAEGARDYEVIAEPLREPSGSVVGVVGARLDVTAHKRAQQALADSRNRLARILDRLSSFVALMTPDGVVLEANDAALTAGGFARDQIVGRPLADTSYLTHPSASRAEFLAALADARRGESITLELRAHVGRPAPILVELRLEPIFDETGTVVEIVGSGNDVTEQRAAETMLRQAQRLDAIGQLASGVAHDFNNLLTVILSSAELMTTAPGELQRELAGEIGSAARRAAELAQRLLSFSRRDASTPKPVDVHAIVREVIQLVSRTFDRRIGVTAHLDATRAVVTGDPLALQGALLNLAVNARDAMPDGGQLTFATRDLTLAAADVGGWPDPLQPGDYVAVTVTDTGHGIPAEIQAQVFDPFFTTKASGQGTGLGLAGVRSCMRLHRGAVRLASAPGRGTTFELVIPRGRARPLAAHVAAPPRAARGARVYVLDDEDLVRRATGRVLASAGFVVSDSGDPVQAMATLGAQSHDYDVVVLDLDMPRHGGIEVFHAVRAAAPTLPVVFCSGYPAALLPAALRLDPRVRFLAKPFHNDDLLATIDSALGPPAV